MIYLSEDIHNYILCVVRIFMNQTLLGPCWLFLLTDKSNLQNCGRLRKGWGSVPSSRHSLAISVVKNSGNAYKIGKYEPSKNVLFLLNI